MGKIVEVLLDEIYCFHREDSKTNRCISIPLKEKFDALEFICSYTPKALSDETEAKRLIETGIAVYVPPEYIGQYGIWRDYLPVVNLLTLSIDYNETYVGCAHRHAPEQRHIISAGFSSPGFLKQPALAGNWRAVINVHAVVSNEVQYRLQVHAHSGSIENN
ncbi:MAG: hypothetical protein LBQ88_12650 [Treponema sp.]|jgi:hypothetical protein|nr:hypothetical protein [Treponema sp.]